MKSRLIKALLLALIVSFHHISVRTIPEYHERPKIHAIVGKDDKKAYLACTFKRASESGVEITVSLMVEGKVVLTASISGTTGIYLFAVSQVDDNLHKKQVG